MADSLIPVSAVILAGGENRRMKIPKAFLEIGGISIIERQAAALTGGAGGAGRDRQALLRGMSRRLAGPDAVEAEGAFFDELIVIANDPVPYESLGIKALPDNPEFSGQKGPLVGVYTGLQAARNQSIFVVACDMPFISGKLARRLAELKGAHDAVVPVIRGYPEPLFAVYSKTVLEYAEKALKYGRPRLQELFKDLDVLYMDESEAMEYDPGLLSFINVNTPEELKMAEGLAKGEVKEG
ncbi:MAG: molybdenum cofactor guanylyltransferase [Nitrospirota bacterium]